MNIGPISKLKQSDQEISYLDIMTHGIKIIGPLLKKDLVQKIVSI